jgi:hypothetical protein
MEINSYAHPQGKIWMKGVDFNLYKVFAMSLIGTLVNKAPERLPHPNYLFD